MNRYEVAVIGGGAAGLMAARAASENEISIAVLEKNSEPAKKIYATGNGRCNVINCEADSSVYDCRSKDYKAADFAEAVLSQAGIEVLVDEFDTLGVILSEEEDGRMYPRSGQAKSVVNALIRGALAPETDIICDFEVKTVEKTEDGFVITSVNGEKIEAGKVIVTTGGKAGIRFGSDGRGFKIAESLGHTVVKPIPALTGFISEGDISSLAGVRSQGFVSLIRSMGGKESLIAYNQFGEIQFTKDAISGICVMDISRNYEILPGASYRLVMDFMWDYDKEDVLAMLEDRRDRFEGFEASVLLDSVLPDKLAAHALKLAEIDENEPCGDVSDKDLGKLAAVCKKMVFAVSGTKSWPEAQVTAGGVSLNEINPETMESEICPGLYFAGEVVDIDGPCGGFNLTWAFASGIVAGRNAGESEW